MGVVPTKGQVALGDHLPPESPPTSPLHVRTVGACVALSNIRCFSCLFQCFVILFFKCRALNYFVFCMLLSVFLCVLVIVFVFLSIVVCFRHYWFFCIFFRGSVFFHSCLYFPSRGLIFSPMVVHFTFAQSSRTSFYTAFSPRHRVQVRMSQDIEENKNISIQLEQNGMSTGCFCIFGNK